MAMGNDAFAGERCARLVKQKKKHNFCYSIQTQNLNMTEKSTRFLGATLGLMLMAGTLAQAQTIDWNKTFGGNGADIGYSIKATADGGYIVAGSTTSNNADLAGLAKGGKDMLLMKLAGDGTVQWAKTFGGSGDDEANSVVATADGGYIIAGFTTSTDGDAVGNRDASGLFGDFLIVKVNSAGTKQWSRVAGGTDDEVAECIIQAADGGYLVVGKARSTDVDVQGNHNSFGEDYDAWVVKLNSNGTVAWRKALGGTGEDIAYSAVQSADGNYVIVGSTNSNDGDVSSGKGAKDLWLLKLSANGSTISWQKCMGGAADDWGKSITNTSDGGFIVAGSTMSAAGSGDVGAQNGGSDAWVLKLNQNGDITWEESFGGSSKEEGSDVKPADDGYILASYTESSGQGGDFLVTKISLAGVQQWSRRLGGNAADYPYAILYGADNKYVVVGRSNSIGGDLQGLNKGGIDVWAIKITPPVPVPLTLLQFSALAQGGNVAISWKTADEVNTSHFTVQRSADGQNFQNLQRIEAKGASSTANLYTAIDAKPLAGPSYYRILMADKDGTTTFSQIVRLNFAGQLTANIWPNPAGNKLALMVNSGRATTASLSITNMLGSVVATKAVQLAQASQRIEWDIQSLPTGAFTITLTTADGQKSLMRFVKQ